MPLPTQSLPNPAASPKALPCLWLSALPSGRQRARAHASTGRERMEQPIPDQERALLEPLAARLIWRQLAEHALRHPDQVIAQGTASKHALPQGP